MITWDARQWRPTRTWQQTLSYNYVVTVGVITTQRDLGYFTPRSRTSVRFAGPHAQKGDPCAEAVGFRSAEKSLPGSHPC